MEPNDLRLTRKNRVSFCSYPAQVCVTHTTANDSALYLSYSLSTPVGTVPQRKPFDPAFTHVFLDFTGM
jgi:hypothetical protein